MRIILISKALVLFFGLLVFSTPVYCSEEDEQISYLAAGIGLEQLTYKEQVPDIELASSDTDLTNWTLFLEGRKTWESFFVGARSYIPLSLDESQEYWTREGEFEQTNSLEYLWFRIDAHVGYYMHRLLNPYIGISWSYSEQERSNFENVNSPGIFDQSALEEVSSFFALFGIQGNFPIASKWSFTYSAEYQLPFYSNITNSGALGWEASNIGGYAYALTGSLNYYINKDLSTSLQLRGGKLHWDGSDWITAGGTRAKWPENDTDFISGFISIYKYF
jgi:hypothetical protein